MLGIQENYLASASKDLQYDVQTGKQEVAGQCDKCISVFDPSLVGNT